VIRKGLISLGAALLLPVLLATSAGAAASYGYVVVKPSAMHGWAFENEGTATGSGQMVFGPAGLHPGVGSAELTMAQRLDGPTLRTFQHDGTRVSSILSLDYSTYTRNANAIALQLAIVNTSDPGPRGYHRLVFEPRSQLPSAGTTSAVVPNQWQRWTPTAATAMWWMTRDDTACPPSRPCTWLQIKAMFPTTPITYGVWFKAGSKWDMDPATSPNKYNVDGFLLIAAVPLTGVFYDFEPETASPGNGDD
jgi:hypothetical protein